MCLLTTAWCCRLGVVPEPDWPECLLCYLELAASQYLIVAATAFAAIARLLCGTPRESKAVLALLLHSSSAVLDVLDSPGGMEALLAAGQLVRHAPGAVAAALVCAARHGDGGAVALSPLVFLAERSDTYFQCSLCLPYDITGVRSARKS